MTASRLEFLTDELGDARAGWVQGKHGFVAEIEHERVSADDLDHDVLAERHAVNTGCTG